MQVCSHCLPSNNWLMEFLVIQTERDLQEHLIHSHQAHPFPFLSLSFLIFKTE